jgi:dynein heavy chain, axonemal
VYLADHNSLSKRPLNLTLFPFAVEHITRICRILRQPGGHALLVGVGGSGRQSLTRLSAFISGMAVYQVEVSKGYGIAEWREDLRSMLCRAGGEQQHSVLLFSDTQLQDEAFLEDINSILKSGEVPNLFPADEHTKVRPTHVACSTGLCLQCL